MRRAWVFLFFIVPYFVPPAPADEPAARRELDRRFEDLLASARKEPGKADWKALRRAYSKTTHYAPYSIDTDEKLKAISLAIGRGEFQKSETDLLALIERDRFMKIDSLAMLMMLYDKTDRPEQAKTYSRLVEGILGVLEYPKAGTSLENPIEVLYVQEEYLVTTGMPRKSQALMIKDGRRYDVFTIKAEGDRPERKVFFNIDLLGNAGGEKENRTRFSHFISPFPRPRSRANQC